MTAESSSRFLKNKNRAPLRDKALPYLLLSPTVAVLIALSIYPLIYAIRVSFTSGSNSNFTLANFARLASDQFLFRRLFTRLSTRRRRSRSSSCSGWGLRYCSIEAFAGEAYFAPCY